MCVSAVYINRGKVSYKSSLSERKPLQEQSSRDLLKAKEGKDATQESVKTTEARLEIVQRNLKNAQAVLASPDIAKTSKKVVMENADQYLERINRIKNDLLAGKEALQKREQNLEIARENYTGRVREWVEVGCPPITLPDGRRQTPITDSELKRLITTYPHTFGVSVQSG